MPVSAWKLEVRALQQERCITCGEIVEATNRSWDHFVPQAFSGKHNASHRLGLVFLAHSRCNSQRGHSPPTATEISRAASIIAALDKTSTRIAMSNIDRLLADQEGFVDVLRAMKKAVHTANSKRYNAIPARPDREVGE